MPGRPTIPVGTALVLGLGAAGGTTAGEAPAGEADGRLGALEDRVESLERRLSTEPAAPRAAEEAGWLEHLGHQLRSLQIHGAVSQGFAWSDRNDYLSMKTSRGSFAWTDATLNVNKRINDRLHAGLQIYTHQLGEFGEFDFLIDYAHLDYRWRDWLGLRIGRNKTRNGLYSDSIDFDFLYPWAFPPFSVYDPSRRSTISHDGLDVYGEIDCGGWGSLDYLAFVGGTTIPDNGGYAAEIASLGFDYDGTDVHYICGIDLAYRAPGPLTGLKLGFTHAWFEFDAFTSGLLDVGLGLPGSGLPPLLPIATEMNSTSPVHVYYPYAEWRRGNWWLAAEYRGFYYRYNLFTSLPGIPRIRQGRRQDQRGWYAMVAYRCEGHSLAGHDLGWMQFSASYAGFYRDFKSDHDLPANYSRDLTASLRLDLPDGWYLKLEAHHIHGAATFPVSTPDATHLEQLMGDPLATAAAGASPTTMLVVKAGIAF